MHLLRRADVAMYRAKNLRLGESMYDPAHDDFSRERLQQIESLRTGIADGPAAAAGTSRRWTRPRSEVTAVEALVRWRAPRARPAVARWPSCPRPAGPG